MRFCNGCFTEKPVTEFPIRHDGRTNRRCKTCVNIRKRRWWKENAAELAAKKRIYEKEHKQEIAERKRNYGIANREYLSAREKRWRKANILKVAEYDKRYYDSPKGQKNRSTKSNRRRARKLNAFVEDINKLDILERDGWVCGICGKKVNPKLKHPHPMSASLDHIIPLALGGKEERKNVQLAHLHCNFSKNTNAVGCQLRVFG